MSDLILKEICRMYETKNLMKEQKKRGERKVDGFRKTLMIPESQIS